MTLQAEQAPVGAPVLEDGRSAGSGPDLAPRGPLLPVGSRRRRLVVLGIQLIVIGSVIGYWQHVGDGRTQRYLIATPGAALTWFRRWVSGEEGRGLWDLATTIYEAAYGWALGLVVGLTLAVILSTSRWLQQFASPFVSLLNALPKIAFAPLFVLFFGQSLRSKVYFVAAGIFFITFHNVYNGIRSIDPVYLRNARILGANTLQLVREVYAPAIVGWVMTSFRLTAAWSLTAAVVAEYLGALKGIGHVISDGQMVLRPEIVIGGILVVATTALIADRLIVRVERRFSRWRL